MDSGIYTAYSGLRAQSDALDILANNLANIHTTGFKEEKAFYTYLNQSSEKPQGPDTFNAVINRSIQAQSTLNFETGSLNETSRELDIAIAGDGFLAVQTPQGVRYTRNGNLNLNAKSVLTTSEGQSGCLVQAENPLRLGPKDPHRRIRRLFRMALRSTA
jgi:flagellar hook-basal body protein